MKYATALAFSTILEGSGFILLPNRQYSSRIPSEVVFGQDASRCALLPLFAKASKKKKKSKPSASASSSGGFGKIAEKPIPRADDDFAVFPKLEPHVEDTISPAPVEWSGGNMEDLPMEVYDRLAQIYGFDQFNYLPVVEDDYEPSPGTSLEDLISVSGGIEVSNGSPASSSSSLSDDDFASLLASATGGEVDTPRSSPELSTPASDWKAISELAPFSKFHVLHLDPLVLAVDDFFTPDECDRYVALSMEPKKGKGEDAPFETRSMTVGKDAVAKAQRTSTTWFHHFKSVPELMAKATRLVGLERIDQWEEPQTVRYRRTEKFTWHLDALSPAESESKLGGQRIATLLVYLTDLTVSDGGATVFRDLKDSSGGVLKVRPKKGSALLFFPSAGGIPDTPLDIRTLHCGEAVDDATQSDKWICQLWLRQSPYSPSAPPGNKHGAAAVAISDFCEAS